MYLLKIKDSKCLSLATDHHKRLRHWNQLSTPLYDKCFPATNYEEALKDPIYSSYKWFCTSRLEHFFKWFPLKTIKALSTYESIYLLIYDSKNHQTLTGYTQTLIIGDPDYEEPLVQIPLAEFVRILENSNLDLENVIRYVATQHESSIHMSRNKLPA